MRTLNLLEVLLFCLIILSGCVSNDYDIVEGKGTVIYLDFEGGFYGIIADDGEHYDPINLPSEFEVDSLRVKFKGKIRDTFIVFTCGELSLN